MLVVGFRRGVRRRCTSSGVFLRLGGVSDSNPPGSGRLFVMNLLESLQTRRCFNKLGHSPRRSRLFTAPPLSRPLWLPAGPPRPVRGGRRGSAERSGRGGSVDGRRCWRPATGRWASRTWLGPSGGTSLQLVGGSWVGGAVTSVKGRLETGREPQTAKPQALPRLVGCSHPRRRPSMSLPSGSASCPTC